MTKRHVKLLFVLLLANMLMAFSLHQIVSDWLWTQSFKKQSETDKTTLNRFIVLSPYNDRLCQFPANTSVTLVTQTSVNNLPMLKQLNDAWSGPIQVAIMLYTTADVHMTQLFIRQLLLCAADAACKFRFHLVGEPYLISRSNLSDFTTGPTNHLCEEVLKVPSARNFVHSHDYPINLLRNAALKGVMTDYVMVIDIDILPSSGLFQKLSTFLSLKSTARLAQRVCFIVPVFERMENISLPISKTQLLSLVQKGVFRPFYFQMNQRCQSATNYPKWMRLSNQETIFVAYEVTWINPYEPFFVCQSKSMPLFDERFVQYGINRLSQVRSTLYREVASLRGQNRFRRVENRLLKQRLSTRYPPFGDQG